MEPFLSALQNSDLSSVLSSCEPELQELMRQIDIMISRQRAEWQAEVQGLRLRLRAEGEELQASRSLAARQEQEMRSLRRQLDAQPGRQELVRKYEQQLQKVREELEKLKRSYHKLQRKQLKERSGAAAPPTETTGSEAVPLRKKIEEYQRLCVEWEQQRLQLQQQVAALEAQNQRLNDELTLSSAQWESLKQERRQERPGSSLEVQRLRAQLEAAQGRVHSQELEVERLRALEARLGRNQRMEQQASADSQDSSVRRATLERQRLQGEADRLNQVLQAKDQVIRCLEGCLAAQGCSGVELLRGELEETSSRLQQAQRREAELRAELACVSERLSQQSAEQPNLEEMRVLRAQYDSTVTEARKVREELLRARQTHRSELDGMRAEVSRLTVELHHRDLAVASMEAERLEQNTAGVKTTQPGNQNLRSRAQRSEPSSPPPEAASSSSSSRASLRDSVGSALTCPEKYEGALLSHAVTERLQPPRESDSRRGQQGEPSGARSEAEIQRLFQQLHTSTLPPSQDAGPRSSSCSFSSSSSSSSSFSAAPVASGRNLPEARAEGQSSGSDDTLGGNRATSPIAEVSLSFSPAERMVSRFLEEENVRSSQLLQRLDSHIQGMIHDNVMTVTRFLPGAPHQDPSPDQDLS